MDGDNCQLLLGTDWGIGGVFVGPPAAQWWRPWRLPTATLRGGSQLGHPPSWHGEGPEAGAKGQDFGAGVEHDPPVEGGGQGGGEALEAFESLGLDAATGLDDAVLA